MSVYQMRMNSYYPLVVRMILESQAIIDSEYPEFDMLAEGRDRVIADAYLKTMSEERIRQWEQILGIQPLINSTLEDRREVIMARIRSQGKLNTDMINSIVNTFTNGTCDSWVEDSTLYVLIYPPPGNKKFQFDNVVQEIGIKVPAHLNYNVDRIYYTWGDIKNNHATWQEVKDEYPSWYDVYLFIPDVIL